MSSLVDHLDNNHSDADENDHINKLFPKCKPRVCDTRICEDDNTTTNNSGFGRREKNYRSDKNCVNNNIVNSREEKNNTSERGGESCGELYDEGAVKDCSRDSFRYCGGVGEVSGLDNGNHGLPCKSRVKRDTINTASVRSNYNRSSWNKHQGGYEILPTENIGESVGHVVTPGKKSSLWRKDSRSINCKYAPLPKTMEQEHLDEHFDNGIGSGASSGSNNSSTFSQSSSSFTTTSCGDKGSLSLSSGIGSSTGSVTLGSSTGGSGLRDSRIEIAGGREVYSQNRIKAGRRVRGSTSMESMLVHQHGRDGIGGGGGGGNENCGGSSKSSSSQSQLAGKSCKGRRKSTHFPSSSNPLLSPTSSGGAVGGLGALGPGNVWEPYRMSGSVVNRKSIPLSPSSVSGRGQGGEGGNYTRRPSNVSMPSGRHSQSKSVDGRAAHTGGRGNRLNCSQSFYYAPPECELESGSTKKSPSMDELGGASRAGNVAGVHSRAGCNLGLSPTSSKMTLKETVFDSEITSIEKPVEIGGGVSGGSQGRLPFVYETPIDGGGEIVFDDIEDEWGRRRGGDGGKKGGKSESRGMECGNMEALNFLDSFIPEHGGAEDEDGTEDRLDRLERQSMEYGGGSEGRRRRLSNQGGGYESDECASSSFVQEGDAKMGGTEGNKRLIGSIPIAEYEGSPKRYGLRLPTQLNPNHLELIDPSTQAVAHLNVTSSALSSRMQSPSSSFSSKVPGFPHRVDTSGGACGSALNVTLPNLGKMCESSPPLGTDHKLEGITEVNSDNSPPQALVTSELNEKSLLVGGDLGESKDEGVIGCSEGGPVTETVDASPDDSVMSQQGSNNTSRSLEDQDADTSIHPHLSENQQPGEDYLLYEFSETRKVLEEFFRPADHPSSLCPQLDGIQRNFDELDYTLKRQAGNSYVGQRLAGESSNEQSEESPKKPPHRRGVLLNVTNEGVASPRLISFQEVSTPSSFIQSAVSPAKPPHHEPPSGLQLGESSRDVNDNDIDADTASSNTETDLGDTEVGLQVGQSRNFTLSPETTDCDSNELESELSLDYEASLHSSSRLGGGIMPILEDGLSSGNLSDNEDREDEDDDYGEEEKRSGGRKKCYHLKNASSGVNNHCNEPNPTLMLMKKQITEIEKEIKLRSQRVAHGDSAGSNNFGMNGKGNGANGLTAAGGGGTTKVERMENTPGIHLQACNSKTLSDIHSVEENYPSRDLRPEPNIFDCNDPELEALDPMRPTPPPSPAPSSMAHPRALSSSIHSTSTSSSHLTASNSHSLPGRVVSFNSGRSNEPPNMSGSSSCTRDGSSGNSGANPIPSNGTHPGSFSSKAGMTGDIGFLQEGGSGNAGEPGSLVSSSAEDQIKDVPESLKNGIASRSSNFGNSSEGIGGGSGGSVFGASSFNATTTPPDVSSHQLAQQEDRIGPLMRDSSPVWVPRHPSITGNHPYRSAVPGARDPLLRKQRFDEAPDDEADTDQETDRLLGQNRTEDDYGFYDEKEKEAAKKKRNKEDLLENTSVLIEGVLFRARYLGSTQLVCEGQPTKATRMLQAEEAVSRIKGGGSGNGSIFALPASSVESGEDTMMRKSMVGGGCKNTVKSDGSYGFTRNVGGGKGERGNGAGEEEEDDDDDDGGEDDEDEDRDDGDSEGNSMEEDFCVGGVVGGGGKGGGIGIAGPGVVGDNNAFSLEGGSGGGKNCGRGLPSSSEMAGLPTSSSPPCSSFLAGGTTFGGSLPHLSPPCGSALPGTMFRLRFVGSLEVEEEVGNGRRRRKRPKKTMVEEAVLKLKAPEGETQPSTEVDLFISTEKIMVLNTDLKEIMMDHALRTISYIADIGDLVVLMARRRPVPTDAVDESKVPRPPKMICHVFESDEAQYIAQSIGQAFQVAYMEFLKANGIEDHSFVREMDYQEVLNSQEIFGDELQMFAKKELQKEVVVPKAKGEILGVVIVESGWGSMLPTVVIANLAPAGAAARCGQLNIGDQIIAINGVSLVGLPLSTCQNYIKNSKNQTVVKLTVVPCPPVVEVKIKRPDTKYQLGFSVQNGVICSLLRGGIAERGGVRVGHRIIEINNQSVVAVPHEKIVNLLATSVGEINMKTMPTSMFRLLTGQETPLYI